MLPAMLLLVSLASADPVEGGSVAGGSVADLAAGMGHSCLLGADGTVECWGGLDAAGFKAGRAPATLVPTRMSGIDGISQLAAGGNNLTCAVRGKGEVWCWDVEHPPSKVEGLQATQVSVGNGHVCATDPKGGVSCWGYNAKGQLGDGTTTNREAPVAVAGLDDVVQVTAGFYHSCALHRTGGVSCWGHNGRGQLGYGQVTDGETTPKRVLYLDDAVRVEAGSFHTCALRRSGHVVCWGSNTSGQLGDSTREDGSAAAAVHTFEDAIHLDVGMDHACAVRKSGGVLCWGSNDQGQLGNDRFKDHLLPTSVGGLTDAISVATGHQHSCAVRRSGALACWGQNWTGQLGDGTRDRRPEPVLVRRD